jgi:hypothetical protein
LAEHEAGVVVIVGMAGVVNCGAIEKEELGVELHAPLLVVIV